MTALHIYLTLLVIGAAAVVRLLIQLPRAIHTDRLVKRSDGLQEYLDRCHWKAHKRWTKQERKQRKIKRKRSRS